MRSRNEPAPDCSAPLARSRSQSAAPAGPQWLRRPSSTTAHSPTARDGRNWAAYGRTFSETHYSPLTEINAATVGRLGLAWSLDLEPQNVLSTPLAVDGVIYFAVGYSIVHAVDARTGRLLWRYDPGVTERAGVKLRTGWGIRGLAYWKGRVFVGTHDGRLLALDARDGTPVWSVQTIDPADGSFVSGPPRVFDDKVVIGFGGGDFGPVRGYVTAYDTATGKQLWRFWTVPGDPARGFENPAMEMAARTWSGRWWERGGGGTVWNAMTYDPEFNRLYLGTGNGGPWNPRLRSPGGGDNLFLSSIVALDADTGAYAWHYQTTPGEAWDYNSAMDMTLADLVIDGRTRKVLLHAPKNGFFYVIDRADGRLLSAEKFAKVTWAERVDLATGRPVVAANAFYEQGEVQLFPSFEGAHNWFPMSFSPRTGLVYLPVTEMGASYSQKGIDPSHWTPIPHSVQFAGIASGDGDPPADSAQQLAHRMGPGPRAPGLEDRDAGCAQQRHARDCRRPRVPGTGRWPHPRLCGRRRPAPLDLRRWNRRARYADHLQRERAPVRRHAVRPVARLGRRIRFRVGAVRLECARASATTAGVRARCERRACRRRRRRGASSRSTHRISGSTRRQSRSGSSSTRAACCATVRARWRAAPRPICAHRRSRSTALHSRQWSAMAASSRGACRSLPELTDRELDALRHYIRYRARLATRSSK